MSSDSNSRTVRNLLLVVVFQLGVCIILLAAIVDGVRGYDTLLATLARFVGFLTALAALLAAYLFEVNRE